MSCDHDGYQYLCAVCDGAKAEDLESQLADAKAVVTMLKKDREDAELQLASARAEKWEAHEINGAMIEKLCNLESETKRLRAAMAAMVAQHCPQESGDYNSGCISANAKALRLLSELGIMEMVHDGIGRQCTAKFARAALDGGNHDNKRD